MRAVAALARVIGPVLPTHPPTVDRRVNVQPLRVIQNQGQLQAVKVQAQQKHLIHSRLVSLIINLKLQCHICKLIKAPLLYPICIFNLFSRSVTQSVDQTLT